jgi:protein involved in polysaccharide export with SLBB domain
VPPTKADPPAAIAKAAEQSSQRERPLPLALLRQNPPDAYRLDAGDVLGVFVEGILGDRSSAPPLTILPVEPPNLPSRVPMVGFPIWVQENGTIALPLLEPIDVRGKTATEVQKMTSRAYMETKLIAPGSRVLVSLARPRSYRVSVARHVMGPVGWEQKVTALDLQAYENDVLTALARSGGMPGTNSDRVVVVIQRGSAAAGANAGDVVAGIQTIRIPLHFRADQPLAFKSEDVILKSGDVITFDITDSGADSSPAGKGQQPAPAESLAVAAPDGRILVQLPGGAWKMVDTAKLSATDTDGKPVANVAERLKTMTAVLVAADGKPPAAQYLQLVKPGTLILVLKD